MQGLNVGGGLFPHDGLKSTCEWITQTKSLIGSPLAISHSVLFYYSPPLKILITYFIKAGVPRGLTCDIPRCRCVAGGLSSRWVEPGFNLLQRRAETVKQDCLQRDTDQSFIAVISSLRLPHCQVRGENISTVLFFLPESSKNKY